MLCKFQLNSHVATDNVLNKFTPLLVQGELGSRQWNFKKLHQLN